MFQTDYNNVDVLLVEDNSNDARIVQRVLKKNELTHKLYWVKNGQEALDFVFAENNFCERDINDCPKLILLDLKLPKLNGLEVLKKIRSDKRTDTIPIVIMTSSKEEQDVLESYKLGVNSYIVKPIDFEKYNIVIKDISFYWLFYNQSYN